MGTIRSSGGYRDLRTFRTATIIYDATYWFCEKFLDSRSRTVDQMVQAARSGRQNIAEGSRASATSSQTELRLVNVARASLDELLLDYEDFLRQRRQPQWTKDDPRAQAVRRVARDRSPSLPAMRRGHGCAHGKVRTARGEIIPGLLLLSRLQGSQRPLAARGGFRHLANRRHDRYTRHNRCFGPHCLGVADRNRKEP